MREREGRREGIGSSYFRNTIRCLVLGDCQRPRTCLPLPRNTSLCSFIAALGTCIGRVVCGPHIYDLLKAGEQKGDREPVLDDSKIVSGWEWERHWGLDYKYNKHQEAESQGIQVWELTKYECSHSSITKGLGRKQNISEQHAENI